MTIAASPPPLAWYGSSFAYYEPPTEAELDASAARAREERRASFSPEQFGRRPGDGDRSAVVVGRFLPVHDGHRYLIEVALTHARRVCVFVRVEDGDPVPWAVRRDWLAELFPQVEVVAVEGGVDEARWAERILAVVRPDYLVSGEDQARRLAQRLGAVVVPVSRRALPVSGTQVREDPWAFERYLPPPVRAWYARRVCVVGAESTGKSTLALQLAEHYGTVRVPEAARSLGAQLRPADIQLAAHAQLVTADRLARRATRVLFCDTDVLSVRLWSERLFGTAPDWVRAAAEEQAADLYLLTAPDLPFRGVSSRNEPAERAEFHAALERELRRLGRPYVHLTGDDRLGPAVEAVDALLAR